jgi:hypothetical protein
MIDSRLTKPLYAIQGLIWPTSVTTDQEDTTGHDRTRGPLSVFARGGDKLVGITVALVMTKSSTWVAVTPFDAVTVRGSQAALFGNVLFVIAAAWSRSRRCLKFALPRLSKTLHERP